MSKAEQNDKLTQVLEMTEHPERFTDEQLQQLLNDKECAGFYRLMCDAASAYAGTQVSLPSRRVNIRRIAAILLALMMLSGLSYAAIRMLLNRQDAIETEQETEIVKPASAIETPDANDKVWTFQNAELQEILEVVTAFYQLGTEYRNEAPRHVRFYVKWDKTEGIQALVERLNKSEKVNIKIADDLLIVE